MKARRSGKIEKSVQEPFRLITDSLPEPIVDVTPDQRCGFNNAAFGKWFGRASEQLKGLTVREVTGEEMYKIIQPYIQNALARQSSSFEGYLSHGKAGRRYVHIDFVSRGTGASGVDGFYFVLRDLTEPKQAEEKFCALVEAAPDAMIIHDAQGRVTLVNSQVEGMFGYSRQELIGQSVEILIPDRFRKTHAEERKAYMRKPVRRPMGARLELYALRKDGSEFPVEISLGPVETAEGILVASTIRDITERKQLAEQARFATVLEERARMARDVHDTLAQGFTGIILNLEAVEAASADLPEEVRSRIKRARDVARENLEEARRSILALSAPHRVAGDLAGAIREIVRHASSSEKTRVDFFLRGTPRPLDAAIEEDLLRIVQQALDNALQHARASEIRIALAFLENEVELQIIDNGRGFLTSASSGQGMGLTGMRDRAQQIGGKFVVESQPGKGTRVGVKVPLSRTQSATPSR